MYYSKEKINNSIVNIYNDRSSNPIHRYVSTTVHQDKQLVKKLTDLGYTRLNYKLKRFYKSNSVKAIYTNWFEFDLPSLYRSIK
jgi:hypothetical protein